MNLAADAINPGGMPAVARRGGDSPPIGVMLLLVTLMPTLVFFVGAASSLAAGTVVASGLVFVAAAAYPNRLGRPLSAGVAVFAVVAVLLGLHLAIAGLLHPIDVGHAVASLAPLLAVVVGGAALGASVAIAPADRIDRAVHLAVWTMCVVAAAGRLGIGPPSSYLKPLFPFTEPSHFVLAFMPLYTYVCIAARPARRVPFLLLGVVLVVGLESLTLAIGWVLIVMLCVRGVILPAIVAATVAALLTLVDLSYFLDRLDFSGGSQNLSTLVWLQGWQLTAEAFAASRGWGLGFQQLGLQGTTTDISRLIYALVGADANILDGGFGVAKILSEFGVIGGALVAALTVLAARSALALRRAVRSPRSIDTATLLSHAIFVGYLIELYVRGAGYFTGSSILVVAAVTLRATERQRRAGATPV